MAGAEDLPLHLWLSESRLSDPGILVALALLLGSLEICDFLLKFTIGLHSFDHFVCVYVQLILLFLNRVNVLTHFGKLALHAVHRLLDMIER